MGTFVWARAPLAAGISDSPSCRILSQPDFGGWLQTMRSHVWGWGWGLGSACQGGRRAAGASAPCCESWEITPTPAASLDGGPLPQDC